MDNCPICQFPMSVALFDAASAAGGSGDTVRLSCHHAFHGHCIVESLRLAGTACPVCRDGQQETNYEQIFMDVFNEMDVDDASTVIHTDDLLDDIRSRNHDIQRERSAINTELTRYNVWKDRLRHRRKAVLEESMRGFRVREIPMARAFQSRIETMMRRVMDKEAAEYARLSSQATLESTPWYTASRTFSARDYLSELGHVPRQDPMNSRFWRP